MNNKEENPVWKVEVKEIKEQLEYLLLLTVS